MTIGAMIPAMFPDVLQKPIVIAENLKVQIFRQSKSYTRNKIFFQFFFVLISIAMHIGWVALGKILVW